MDEKLREEIGLLDRRGTDCEKWDGLTGLFDREDLLPLWVADMDFKVPACVREALHRAVDHGAFGYYVIPDGYYESILGWEQRRHGTRLQREWIRNAPSVVTGLFHLIQALTEPGDAVLIQTPVYMPFYRIIGDTGRRGVYAPLREEAGVYTIDLAEFERKIVAEDVKAFILCSPHNPVGRVWTQAELEGMLDCCQRHGVQVFADEIHHDLIQPGHRHISAASLWKGEGKPVTLFSASKSFNLAGMKNAILVLPEAEQRTRFDRFEQGLGTGEGSTLDYIAVAAAFQGGDAWLDAVLAEVSANYQQIKKALAPYPEITVSPLEGTYLMWIDLGKRVDRGQLHGFMEQDCRIAPDYGHWFYPEGEKGDTHIRLNLAAPQETIRRAAEQLAAGLEALH